MSLIQLPKTDLIIDQDNIIYSKGYSRPSKSILTPELFNKYKNIKEKFTIFEDLRGIAFNECINYVFNIAINVNDNIYSLDDLTFKIINFKDNKFDILTSALSDKYTNYIIELNDIYTYPKIQYLYALTGYFENVKISMSQFCNYNLIICYNRIKPLLLVLKDNTFVKDFNIKVDENIIVYLKECNDKFFSNIICINNKINMMCQDLSQICNLNREIYTINKYYTNFITKKSNNYCDSECNCRPNSIFYSDILECYICENCLVLTGLFLGF